MPFQLPQPVSEEYQPGFSSLVSAPTIPPPSEAAAVMDAFPTVGVESGVTQGFMNYNPGLEKFSGGYNLGTDFGVGKGNPLQAPPGQWVVTKAFGGAKEGNKSANKGSGNLVEIRNIKTGETLAFEHLSQVPVKPGQLLKPGQAFALTGNTGNTTGPHASIVYKDGKGQLKDVLQSPYAGFLGV